MHGISAPPIFRRQSKPELIDLKMSPSDIFDDPVELTPYSNHVAMDEDDLHADLCRKCAVRCSREGGAGVRTPEGSTWRLLKVARQQANGPRGAHTTHRPVAESSAWRRSRRERYPWRRRSTHGEDSIGCGPVPVYHIWDPDSLLLSRLFLEPGQGTKRLDEYKIR
jgi:hypothetical protein